MQRNFIKEQKEIVNERIEVIEGAFIGIVVGLVLLVVVTIIVGQHTQITDLENKAISLQAENEFLQLELNEYRYEETELNNCRPVCGKKVELKPIDDSFYIECEQWNGNDGCGLKTGYYDSKAELIREWNNED